LIGLSFLSASASRSLDLLAQLGVTSGFPARFANSRALRVGAELIIKRAELVARGAKLRIIKAELL
jgi:hypothetical protein